jgi:hypothetical protein
LRQVEESGLFFLYYIFSFGELPFVRGDYSPLPKGIH